MHSADELEDATCTQTPYMDGPSYCVMPNLCPPQNDDRFWG